MHFVCLDAFTIPLNNPTNIFLVNPKIILYNNFKKVLDFLLIHFSQFFTLLIVKLFEILPNTVHNLLSIRIVELTNKRLLLSL